MIRVIAFFLCFMLFSMAKAQIGAAATRAALSTTYSEAEILGMFGGQTISRTATLPSGVVFPALLAGAGIYAALDWFYNQARSTGTSLDEWRNLDPIALYISPDRPSCMTADGPHGLDGAPSYGQNGGRDTYFRYNCAYNGIYVLWGCGPFPNDLHSVTGSYPYTTLADAQQEYDHYVQTCTRTARPSLPDWIRGTYPGGVPHPDAVGGINSVIGQWLPSVAMPTPIGAPGVGIMIGQPAPTQPQWDTGCLAGQTAQGNVCVTPDTTCPTGQVRPSPGAACQPETSQCPTGQIRLTPGGSCQPDPGAACPTGQVRPSPGAACQPEVAECPSGQYRPFPSSACQPVQEPCQQGYSRPAPGAACVPDSPPAPIQAPCRDMVAGDGVIGFVVTFFPNVIALTKCMFVPTRDIPGRVSGIASSASTRFPFSIAVQLNTAFVAPASGQPAALPTDGGLFTFDWGWLVPLWQICKTCIGTFIWFSALWYIWGRVNPQVVI